MARGKRNGVSDIESEAKLQDLETLLEQMIASGEKVFRLSLNVLLKSENLEDLEDKVNQALIAVRSLGSSEAMQETIAAFDIFSQMALPNARAAERSKRVKTSNLADLLPIYGAWTGTTEPSVLLRSSSGALLKFDPFDADFTNSNMLISGGSGSGKSFLTNIILMQMLKENPKIFFVDIGGSYKKLCENLEGQYLPLGVSEGISINPFDLAAGEEVVSNQKIKFLVGLIELMAKEEDVSRLPKLERAEVEEATCPFFKHDLHVLAAHYGEWIPKGSAPDVRFVTEQELRRIDDADLPKWAKPLQQHKPDGVWYFPETKEKTLYALEVELSRKRQHEYETLGAFYSEEISISSVLWIVQGKANARSVVATFKAATSNYRDIHNFVLLDDFRKLGWASEIFLGPNAGTSIHNFLEKARRHQTITTPSPSHHLVAVQKMLDFRLRRFNSSTSASARN